MVPYDIVGGKLDGLERVETRGELLELWCHGWAGEIVFTAIMVSARLMGSVVAMAGDGGVVHDGWCGGKKLRIVANGFSNSLSNFSFQFIFDFNYFLKKKKKKRNY